jgi:outer membrane protein TolC
MTLVSCFATTGVYADKRVLIHNANFRTAPDITAPLIDILAKGREVNVKSQIGDWVFTGEGFIHIGNIEGFPENFNQNPKEEEIKVTETKLDDVVKNVPEENATIEVTEEKLDKVELIESVKPIQKSETKTKVVEQKADESDYIFQLSDVVKSVVNQNSNLLFEKINVDIAKTNIDEAAGAFETNFFFNVGKSDSDTKNNTKDAIVRDDTDTYDEQKSNLDIGVEGINRYGTSWSFSLQSEKTNSSLIEADNTKDIEYESKLELELKQPLLKNFGRDIGETNLQISKLKTKEAKELYKKKTMELIGNTIVSYWRLYSAIEIHETWKETIELAKKQEENIRQKVSLGNMSEVSLLEIQNSIRSSKIEMLVAQDMVNKERFQLLNLMNVSAIENRDKLYPTDKPQLDKIQAPLLQDAIELASNNWLDLNVIQKRIAQEKLVYKYSKNQAQADLELVGRVSHNTLENSFSKSIDEVSNDDFGAWFVGLNFSMPIEGNMKAKSNITKSQLKLNKLLEEEKSLKNILTNSLSSMIENLKLNKSKMVELQKALDFRIHMVDVYTKQLEYGKINVEDLTDAYKERVLSKRQWLKGLMDIKLSQTVLDIAIGTLLEKYEINIEE